MIGRLSGTLETVALTHVLVDVHGVGYDVLIPMSTCDALPPSGQPVTLLIHTDVREDAIVLYGFATEEERTLFRDLTTVSGIGPKIALNILSCMSISNFCAAVVNGDVRSLQAINGIGKKSAERMIVELRDTFSKRQFPVSAPGKNSTSTAGADAVHALELLGFRRESAQKTVQKLLAELPETQCSSEQLIRLALAALNR